MSLSVLMLLEGNFPAMGGAERQLETLAHALLAQGCAVSVLVPRLHSGQPAGVDRHGPLPVFRIAYPQVRLFGTLVLLLRLAWFLVARRHEYDAIHVHIAHNMGAVASLVGRLLGKPVVVKFSGWWEQEKGCLRPTGGAGAALARWMLRRASAVQGISTRIIAELAARGFSPRRLHWLPNGVPMDRFAGIRRPPGGCTPPTVLFVGRLVPEKGLDTLLAAWAQARRPPGWRLRLVGEGPLRATLEAQARALGIAASVELPGQSERVEEDLAGADLGVLPSRFEGLSNTLLEGMAAGLPMLASRISGNEDFVVPGRNGWLFEPGDVAGLAAALSVAMALPAAARQAMGEAARADVLAKASVPAVIGQLLPLYREAKA